MLPPGSSQAMHACFSATRRSLNGLHACLIDGHVCKRADLGFGEVLLASRVVVKSSVAKASEACQRPGTAIQSARGLERVSAL